MRSIALLSNAKINLFFSVNALRPDGYCDISSIMLPVNFGDKLTFSKIDTPPHGKPTIAINLQPSPQGFDHQNNTVLAAIDHFQKATNMENLSLKIDIEKKIPIGGGFGGGSGNALCTLNALNALYGNALPASKFLQIAQNIGMDCPFFIQNCPQLATGRGDMLQPLPPSFCEILSSYFALLFCPEFSISTQVAYGQLKKNFSPSPGLKIPDEQLLRTQNLESITHNIFQDLILESHPPLKFLFQRLKKYGYNPCLSGSGSGCFIIHRDKHFLELAKPIIAEILCPLRLLTIATFKIFNGEKKYSQPFKP
jgi:4-diphosphocytidyl-2-C-methyl-D-erythritol kinase